MFKSKVEDMLIFYEDVNLANLSLCTDHFLSFFLRLIKLMKTGTEVSYRLMDGLSPS